MPNFVRQVRNFLRLDIGLTSLVSFCEFLAIIFQTQLIPLFPTQADAGCEQASGIGSSSGR